ncbi:hypothetical protein JXD38_06610 [candidate division WOR-3 bacterium]|nr:hypothetical protein [candidate division WOR-3 bacterium]
MLVGDADDRSVWLPEYGTWVDQEVKFHFGVSIRHENCFEFSLAPPERLLRWLLEDPGHIVIPDDWPPDPSSKSVPLREELFGRRGPEAQDAARRTALDALREGGVESSEKKWWAFEGFTEVDCLLETQKAVIAFEGKRTERQSARVYWLPDRNQVVRNIEAVEQYAERWGKAFAFILVVEQAAKEEEEIVLQSVEASLPHLKKSEREELMRHFLGCITWGEACEATVPYSDYSSLPHTVCDVVERWRAQRQEGVRF